MPKEIYLRMLLDLGILMSDYLTTYNLMQLTSERQWECKGTEATAIPC